MFDDCSPSKYPAETSFVSDDIPPALRHDLRNILPELAKYDSLEAVENSVAYRRHQTQIQAVLNCVVGENFAASFQTKASQSKSSDFVRVAAWNIERGKKLAGIIQALREHESLNRADIFLMTELDCGMARTGNAFVARDIAQRLKLNYVFAPSYLSLNKGSGLEADASGENTHALHGNALFSIFPITNAHAVRLPNGKDKMRGREKRLGSQRAVIADIAHPAGVVRAVSIHLDAHSSQKHRARQMQIVVNHLAGLPAQFPVIIGGDWNTSTYNSRRAAFAIAGFFRRVMMGVGNFLKNHYPYPDRWFERHLFRMLERNGYDYRTLNQTGAGTLHYDVRDVAQFQNMAEWIPDWCFWFIKRALTQAGGRCSLKLDWFAGKNIAPFGDNPARVIGDLRDANSGDALSDHDPIVLDFQIK
ncbi:MAG: hypothetical protein MSG64_11125 [Pyrinomonadaceae bacterium MAG19_C2-C3]|nr:hypothetical protein [Pyrinomonadaceae bacterium MAG19_C2-C3]